MRTERTWALAGGLLLLLCLLPFAGSGVINNDELTYLSHAQRMVAGELPYRDFFEFLPPVTLWLLAGAFALGGVHLVLAHALAAAAVGVVGVQLYRVGRQLELGPLVAWLPAYALVFCLFASWPVWSHHWLVVPFDVGAVAFAMRGLAGPGYWPWLAAGACVGLAGFTVQTDGAAVGLVLATTLLLDGWQRRAPWAETLRRLGWLAAGVAAVAGGVAGALAATGSLGAAFEQVVKWPMTRYRQPGGINDFAFGTDLPAALSPMTALPGWYVRAYLVIGSFAILPTAALGALAWLAGWMWAPRRPWDVAAAHFALVSLWCLAALWLGTHAGRSDLVHVAQYALPGVLWGTVAAMRIARQPLGAPAWLPLAAIVAFVAAGALGQAKAMSKDPDRWMHPGRVERQVLESPAIAYLHTHARPGDQLAAMPYGGFFYVFGLPPATRYTLMLPPSMGYGAPGEFAAYFDELARRRPRFVVIAPWAWKAFELAVDDYATHLPPGYRRVGEFGSPQYNYLFPAVIYERVTPP
ncbi:MAG: hypothetical protein JWM80_749 [Cyanobacteria bacterium RYN_339]|nr:hypothetical protein [Cyanobacteria bacterium RYN_339]